MTSTLPGQTNGTATGGAYGSTSNGGPLGDPGSTWTVADKAVAPNSPGPGPNYGPSSGHPAVVIVGMADGSVQSLNKRIDGPNGFVLYWFGSVVKLIDPLDSDWIEPSAMPTRTSAGWPDEGP